MTDAKEEGLWDYLEIYCATTKTDNLGITALSISYYEEMFRNPSEFDISLKKKKGLALFSLQRVALQRFQFNQGVKALTRIGVRGI